MKRCFWFFPIAAAAASHRCLDPAQICCPRVSPAPYPHSLTSISPLVSPEQIRKASRCLHGDGPRPSRWPQRAARQLKREHEQGRRKWVRTRGRGGRSRRRTRQRPHASGENKQPPPRPVKRHTLTLAPGEVTAGPSTPEPSLRGLTLSLTSHTVTCFVFRHKQQQRTSLASV